MFYKKKYLEKVERKRFYSDRERDKKSLFLDRNEKFTELNSKAKARLLKNIKKINLGLYPNVEGFYKKLSKWLNLERDNIFITEGVSGAIKNIIECYTVSGKSNIIFPYPTFALYPVFCKLFNLKQKKIFYTKDHQIKFNSLLDSIDKNTAIVFLPNPNIPIEGNLSRSQILLLIKKCKKFKVILAIDEVYYPFNDFTFLKLIKKYKYLLIMRSFSKAYGLAGIRLGYIIGNKEVIKYIAKFRGGYETNSTSITIASFFIDNKREVLKYIQEVKRGFRLFKKLLKLNHLSFVGGNNGNFIYVILKNKKVANTIINKLKAKRILVRGDWPKPYDNGILVTGTTYNNFKKFIKNFFLIYKKINQ